MEHDLLAERARPVKTRFELAIGRMIEAWVAAGRMKVSTDDLRIAREYLDTVGARGDDLTAPEGELSPEATIVAAMRRLARA